MKSLTYYFHIKTKILAGFQIYISVPLTILDWHLDICPFIYHSGHDCKIHCIFLYTLPLQRNLWYSSSIQRFFHFFQNVLIRFEKFFSKRRDPTSFKCKPLRLNCLLAIFQYLIISEGWLIDRQ